MNLTEAKFFWSPLDLHDFLCYLVLLPTSSMSGRSFSRERGWDIHMKRGFQVQALYSLLVFSFLTLLSSSAMAEGHFPDPNTNLAFRSALVEALTQRARHFTYQQENESHDYIVRYGEDYEMIRRYFQNPLREKIRRKFQDTQTFEDQGIHFFKKLAEKITYFPLDTDSQRTQQYETFIQRPVNTISHGTELQDDQEIPYVEGTFLEAISTKPQLVVKSASQHPEFQGPYFTFTLTEIPKEYLSTQSKLKAFPRVRNLIQQFIRDTKSKSEALTSMKNLILRKERERALLIERFTNLYGERAFERATLAARASNNPANAFLQNYSITLTDLTQEQLEKIAEIDKVRAAARIAYNRIYAREVTLKLTPKNLVPFLVQNLTNSDVVSLPERAQLAPSDDDDAIPDYYAVYALSKVGQDVFDFMKRNELY